MCSSSQGKLLHPQVWKLAHQNVRPLLISAALPQHSNIKHQLDDGHQNRLKEHRVFCPAKEGLCFCFQFISYNNFKMFTINSTTWSRVILSGVDDTWYSVRSEHSSSYRSSDKQHMGGSDQGGHLRASCHPASFQTFFHTGGR